MDPLRVRRRARSPLPYPTGASTCTPTPAQLRADRPPADGPRPRRGRRLPAPGRAAAGRQPAGAPPTSSWREPTRGWPPRSKAPPPPAGTVTGCQATPVGPTGPLTARRNFLRPLHVAGPRARHTPRRHPDLDPNETPSRRFARPVAARHCGVNACRASGEEGFLRCGAWATPAGLRPVGRDDLRASRRSNRW